MSARKTGGGPGARQHDSQRGGLGKLLSPPRRRQAVGRRLRSIDVLETLAELFVTHGVPAHIRSDNGPEFTATVVRL